MDKKNIQLKRKEIIRFIGIALAYLFGLSLQWSPLLIRYRNVINTGDSELADTTNMVIGEGTYSGFIIKNTTIRNGYGRYETSTGSIYEGNWKDDILSYGTRTSKSSVYTGRFDEDMNNSGFGIISYSDQFIEEKTKQGIPDTDIIVKYIGNWKQNNKEGLGRSIKKDGSMDFGYYSQGVIQSDASKNYRIGGSVYGIDASHFQNDIDWDNLALYCDKNGNVFRKESNDKTFLQPVFFVYLKATEGATIKDEMYEVRMIEAERHGIVKGAYHFLHLGVPIDSQLQNFQEIVSWNRGDLPPALDVEVESEIEKYGIKALQSMALEWLEKVEAKMGVRPVIYTRETIRNKYLNDSKFRKYQFWIARYSDNGPDNFDWQIWQKTENGRIKGYNGDIDINLFRGNYDSFMKYLGN